MYAHGLLEQVRTTVPSSVTSIALMPLTSLAVVVSVIVSVVDGAAGLCVTETLGAVVSGAIVVVKVASALTARLPAPSRDLIR